MYASVDKETRPVDKVVDNLWITMSTGGGTQGSWAGMFTNVDNENRGILRVHYNERGMTMNEEENNESNEDKVIDEIVKEFIEDYISDDVRDELEAGLKTLSMDEVDAALEVYVKAMLTGDDWRAFEALVTLWKAIDEWGEA